MGKFNLITEPWIPFLKKDGTYGSVGFAESMINMKDFACINCNSRMTDESVLGVLAALAHTILYRYDENGHEQHIRTQEDAMNRIDSMVKHGGIPKKAADAYFDQWKDRFFLFDEKYPFFQSPLASMDHPETTSFSVEKLKRRVLQSRNKRRWRVPEDPYAPLSYADAAKEMIACVMYDDCAIKPKGRDHTSGVGYLGTFAVLSPETGSFLTDMVARICLLDEEGKPYAEPEPLWEKNPLLQPVQFDPQHPDVNAEPYHNIPSFYTCGSRRIFLNDDEEHSNVKTFSLRHGERRNVSSETGAADPRMIWRGGQDGRIFSYGGTNRKGLPTDLMECMNSILGKEEVWTPSDTKKDYAQKLEAFSEKSVKRPGLITWMKRVRMYLPDMMTMRLLTAQYGTSFGCLCSFHVSSTLFPKTFLDDDGTDQAAVVGYCSSASKIADTVFQFGRTLDASVGRDARKSPSTIRRDLAKKTYRVAESSLREAIILAKRSSGTDLESELSKGLLALRETMEKECIRIANDYAFYALDDTRGSGRVPVPRLIQSTRIELHQIVPNAEKDPDGKEDPESEVEEE